MKDIELTLEEVGRLYKQLPEPKNWLYRKGKQQYVLFARKYTHYQIPATGFSRGIPPMPSCSNTEIIFQVDRSNLCEGQWKVISHNITIKG